MADFISTAVVNLNGWSLGSDVRCRLGWGRRRGRTGRKGEGESS